MFAIRFGKKETLLKLHQVCGSAYLLEQTKNEFFEFWVFMQFMQQFAEPERPFT